MKPRMILPLIALCLTSTAQAQHITFESQDYKSIGVYDTWEESPFRTGKLEGRCLITPNFDKKSNEQTALNTSSTLLAVQRSRYGSNTFGARIDLKETFELTPTTQYVHVLIHKPVAGRVMLVGLGKRKDRAGQSPETEQFWALGQTEVPANQWTDVVFAIKGNGGIDIHSLVVVPDCESPHALHEDFICYIDEIIRNNESAPRFTQSKDYPLNYDVLTANPRHPKRSLKSIALSAPSHTGQRIGDVAGDKLYTNHLSHSFTVKAGETVTPSFDFAGDWMHGYVYVDWNNDGTFSPDLPTTGKPTPQSELVTYAYYNGKNSTGNTVSNMNVLNPPSFTIPAGTKTGLYRMRFKVDWDCIDPAGNTKEGNRITENGGAIVDVMLNVHGETCAVNDANRNGEVLSARDGTKLSSYQAPFGKDFTIRMNPERGFEYAGIRLRHGYNLAGDSLVHGNPQYQDIVFGRELFEKDELTIPAQYMDGDVEIEGLFVEKGTLPTMVNITYNVVDAEGNVITQRSYKALEGEPLPATGLTSQCSSAYWSLESIPNEKVGKEDKTFDLAYVSKFPFEVTTSLDKARWYNLMLTSSPKSLYYATTPIKLNENASTSVTQSQKSRNLWCFMGNAFDGFRLVNAVSQEQQVLASYRNMQGSAGGSTYPVMVDYPYHTPDAYNTSWQVIQSKDITKGFYLAHTENTQHKMNSRQNTLAFWSEGADAGSTFTVKYVGTEEELQTAQRKQGVVGDTYEMVFHDEFEGEGNQAIDRTKWVTSPRYSAAWNRFISDDPKVAFLEDGSLVCRAIKNEDKSQDKADMLTGAKQTSQRFSFTYGYIEVRAKTTPHAGNFPAIWLMPDDQADGWPGCGEIDIWETINNEDRAYMTIHSKWANDLGQSNNPQKGGSTFCLQNGEWHTYGLLKEENRLTWYIDGNPMFSYNKLTTSNALTNKQWPFNKPFYIILNQSVGNGSWAGQPDTSFVYETRFDYCRVYQTPTQAAMDGHATGLKELDIPHTTSHAVHYDLAGRAWHSSDTTTLHSIPKGVHIVKGKKILYR